ncbi:MAG: hypothetical protein QM664_07265 [Flavihumibacter sp.]
MALRGSGDIHVGYRGRECADGAFEVVTAKEGTYKMIVEAKPPYRNVAKDNITVANGQSTDEGR